MLKIKMIYREGVCCIGFTPDRTQIVLTKRRDLSVWCLPGGGIEPDEKPEQAAVREFTEETGFYVSTFIHQGTYDIKIPKFYPVFWDRTYTYVGIITRGTPRISDEVKETKMFEVNNLPKGFLFYQKTRVQDAINKTIHLSPIIQQVRVRDVLEAIVENFQVLKHPLRIYRDLTITSTKRED